MTAKSGKVVTRLTAAQTVPLVITNVYSLPTKIDIPVPYFPGPGIPFPTLSGKFSVLRIYGSVKDAAATSLFVTTTFDQAGLVPWLEESSAAITVSPFGGAGGSWTCGIKLDELFVLNWKDLDANGTFSIFLKTNNQTATVTDVHFLYEE
tara:strand:+ start:2282 stop:2731 length:450 start_codon:yes stop_codon:yes gene_type:complete